MSGFKFTLQTVLKKEEIEKDKVVRDLSLINKQIKLVEDRLNSIRYEIEDKQNQDTSDIFNIGSFMANRRYVTHLYESLNEGRVVLESLEEKSSKITNQLNKIENKIKILEEKKIEQKKEYDKTIEKKQERHLEDFIMAKRFFHYKEAGGT